MWIEITIARLQQKLSAAEYSAITSTQLPANVSATTLLTEEIESTTNMVRGYVSGNRENSRGPDNTIPSELEDAALAILRVKIFTRIPGLQRLIDSNRTREYEEALAQLRDTSAGRFRIAQPDTPSPTQPSGPTITVVRKTPRQSSRQNWSGTL
jgi:hypothetical protein